MKNFLYYILLIACCLACVKEPKEESVTPQDTIVKTDNQTGFYLLHEGLWNQNNASLSYFNFQENSFQHQVFEQQNQRKLGDTGNDMKQYGAKLYIIVSSSNTLEVINPKTGKSIEQISFLNGEKERTPRQLAFYNNYCFVSCFDGNIAVIDTNSLVIEKWTPVGRNPEGMVIQNNNLFVANSGGLSYPNYDTTVSIINLSSLEEIKKITVQLNPTETFSDTQGHVYVLSAGNHKDISPMLQKIDQQHLVTSIDLEVNQVFQHYDSLLLVSNNHVKIFDMKTEKIIDHDFLDLSTITTLRSIYIHPTTGNIFCLDANNYTQSGIFYWYNTQKQLVNSFKTGLIPSKINFITH